MAEKKPKAGTAQGFGANILTSGKALAKNLISAGANPLKTLETLISLATDLQFGDGSSTPRQAVVAGLKDRYGSLENLKKAAYNDPMGVLSDASILLGGAGAVVKGAGLASKAAGLGRTAEVLGGVGRVATSAGELVDPVMAASKAASKIVKGAGITVPTRTYQDGVITREALRGVPAEQMVGKGGQNIWARQSEAKSNADRTLMVQFSDSISAPKSDATAQKYYDTLYSGSRKGYSRPSDFWELPEWQVRLSGGIKNADSYVVRNMDEAKAFLNEAGYGHVAFSAMDTNKHLIEDIAGAYKGKIDVGGYGNLDKLGKIENIKVHKTAESLIKDVGGDATASCNYRLFKGTPTIPRMALSTGCKHGCAFCTVEKGVKEVSKEQVLKQADELARDLPSSLIYLNDKTFGQAKNHTLLPEVYERIKAQNPNFQGFIVQTTAAQMTKLAPEFIDASGIKFIEMGMETYNNPILKEMRKPATEAIINQATNKIRQTQASLIPNVMIGLPGETADTYGRTLKYINDNEDIISHSNIYNLAVYDESKLGRTLKAVTEADKNENTLAKSWMGEDITPHEKFSADIHNASINRLNKPLFAPKPAAPVQPQFQVPVQPALQTPVSVNPSSTFDIQSVLSGGDAANDIWNNAKQMSNPSSNVIPFPKVGY